jgi:YHS domain-containing protein
MLVICLALALIASMGCSGKPQNDEDSTTTQDNSADKISSKESVPEPERTARPDNLPEMPFIDPVDGSLIKNAEAAMDSCFYKGVKLYFNSKENRVEFQKDPEKFPGRLPKL